MSNIVAPSSLLTLAVHYLSKNWNCFESKLDILKSLPNNVKDRLLHVLTACYYSNLDIETVLNIFLHNKSKKLDLTNFTLTNKTLLPITNGKELKVLRLNFQNCNIDPICLEMLFTKLPKLQEVNLLHCTTCTDSVLKSLSNNCPCLVNLDITGCIQITDEGVGYLCDLPNLQVLNLSKSQVTDEGIYKLCQGANAHNIYDLSLKNCLKVTSKSLKTIIDHCRNLQVLLMNNNQIQPEAMDVLSDSKLKLKQLYWTV